MYDCFVCTIPTIGFAALNMNYFTIVISYSKYVPLILLPRRHHQHHSRCTSNRPRFPQPIKFTRLHFRQTVRQTESQCEKCTAVDFYFIRHFSLSVENKWVAKLRKNGYFSIWFTFHPCLWPHAIRSRNNSLTCREKETHSYIHTHTQRKWKKKREWDRLFFIRYTYLSRPLTRCNSLRTRHEDHFQ